MKNFLITLFVFLLYNCAVPLSIGNNSVNPSDGVRIDVKENTVYTSNGKTMVAVNYILPQKAGQFEMLTKTVILPAIRREDVAVYRSLKFLIPENNNDDGTLTFMFIADPYLEEKNYDIFEILVKQYGRARAEDYFDRWISCFAYEQEVISFR